MKNTSKVLTIVITLLVLSLGLNMFLGYRTYLNTKVQEGVKEKITIEVIVDTPNLEKQYYSYVLAGSKVEYLSEAMDALGMDYKTTELGFVETINELTAVWDGSRKEYWSITINGKYGELGINVQTVRDGDVIKFTFTDES